MPFDPDYQKESMLIVDDNDLVRDTLYRLVKALGFSAEVASDGMEALEILESRTFTFLLTDMKMPGMDGMDLIREARATLSGPQHHLHDRTFRGVSVRGRHSCRCQRFYQKAL